MKLETFFEKFEQFTDVPNAVGKMRELVLELACCGKLVEQSSNDEFASKLLVRIESHLELLRSRRELRGSPVEPLDRNELPVIPTNWEWVPLGNVVDYGSSVKSESADIPDGAWLLDLEDIEKDTSRLLQRKTFGESPSKSTKTAFRAGDVLYGKLRPYLNKVLVADAPGYCTTEIIPICTFGFIEPAYLSYALKRPEFLAYANSKSYGMNLPRLGTDDARRAPFPLPPLAEQKRIVAKVDELMALCDRLEAQQQERDNRHAALARASLARFAEAPTPANLDFLFHHSYTITPTDLRKSILTLAVQGKLVPQDPNDEPADQLLVAIAKQREKLIGADTLRRSKSCRQFLSNEAPHEIPDTWVWTMLGEIADIGTGSTPSRTEASFWMNGSIPWITSGSTSTSPIIEGDEFVTESAVKAHRLRVYQPGTLLVAMYGQGKTRGQVALLGISATINQACAAISALEGIAPMQGYLKLLLEKQYDEMRLLSAGGAQPNLNVQKIKEVFVPLPPLAEQRRIVAKVDQLMALVDQLESQLAVAKARSAALLEAVVHELLTPSVEVIDLASYRAAIGCYTIRKMSQQPYFGRTAAMKMLYLAEAHVGLNLGFQPERKAAGPLDPWLYRFEEEAKQKAWFKAVENTSNGKMKVEYQPGKMLAAQAAQAESQLARKQRKEFDRLLDLLSDKKTEEVEIIATLFAVWNDFLIDGHAPGDDEIVTEVRENWHVKKERFSPAQLRQWLGWLRKNSLVPHGRPPHTVHQSKLSLN